MTNVPSGFMTKADVMSKYSLSLKVIDAARYRGELPSKKIGKSILFKPEWVDEWLATPDNLKNKHAARG